MADELTVRINVNHNKNPKINFNPGVIQVPQIGEGVFARPIYVGLTPQTIEFTGIDVPILVIVWNVDPENSVSAGVDEGGILAPLGLLRPNAKFPLISPWHPDATLMLKAEIPEGETGTAGTGTFDEFAKVQVIAYEE